MDYIETYSLIDLGQLIAKLRKERGYSQEEFASLLGVSHATLSNIENGKPASSGSVFRALQILGYKVVVVPK